jgi:4-amino-4-deoxy-L-arabinose transferase-like glycosyltransferase
VSNHLLELKAEPDCFSKGRNMADSTTHNLDSNPPFKVGVIIALVLVVIHVSLAFWYASITPYRQPGKYFSMGHVAIPDVGAPDERQHANYVQHLLDGKGFPVFDPHDPNLGEDYQSHQPPAYYILEAGWAKIVGVTDVSDVHEGLKLRALNCLIGGVTVFAVFLLGAWGFNAGVGLCAAAVAALLPMNVALSGAMSNDPLLYCLCTVSLALCARGIGVGWSVKLGLAVGVTVGLALLTKTTAIALLPAVLVAVLISPNRPNLRVWLAALIPILVLPAGWWMRNQHLYGDPFAIQAFNQAFVNSPQAKVFIEGGGLFSYLTSMVGWWTLRSFFGAFGYMDIWLNETGLPGGQAHNLLYRLLIMLSFVLLLGWVVSLSRLRGRGVLGVQVMNVTFGVVVLLLFLSFNMHYFQAQARYLYPAIGPICCAFGLGATQLFKGKWASGLVLLVLVFGGTSIYAGTQMGPQFEARLAP